MLANSQDRHRIIEEVHDGRVPQVIWEISAHAAFGAAPAPALLWLCAALPRCPLHPVGLVMVNTFHSSQAWGSILIDWLIKVGVLCYEGARPYEKARPLFIGLIVGEVSAAAFWGVEATVRALMDLPYKAVPVLPC